MRAGDPIRLSDGVLLHTQEYGAAADDAELTVVLLHGWTLDSRLWHRQVADLPARLGAGVRIVAYDSRGHGRSGETALASATLAQLGDDLAAVLRACVPDGPVLLVGHSLGGMTILEHAHRHAAQFADRVAGVVLVSSTAEGSTHTRYGLGSPIAQLVRLVEQFGAGVVARGGSWRPHRVLGLPLRPALRWLLFGDRADAPALRLTQQMLASVPLRSVGGFRAAVAAHHRVDVLAAMRAIPVTVLVGSRDRLTPDTCARTIARELPAATAVTLAEAGHMLPLERADEVTDAIGDVVDRLRSAGRAPAQHFPDRSADASVTQVPTNRKAA